MDEPKVRTWSKHAARSVVKVFTGSEKKYPSPPDDAGPSSNQVQRRVEIHPGLEESQKALHKLYLDSVGVGVPAYLRQCPEHFFDKIVKHSTPEQLADAITQGTLRKATKSFSAIEWADICESHQLDNTRGHIQFPHKPFPGITLPRVVQNDLFDQLFTTICANRPPASHSKERQHELLLTPMIANCLSFFGGILHNEAEGDIPGDKTSTGGHVEIIIRAMPGAIVIFIEVKQQFPSLFQGGPPLKVLAQAVAEMSAAYSVNKKMGYDFPVFAVVTDLYNFYYYSFDGSQFRRLGSFDKAQAATYGDHPEPTDDDVYTAMSLLSSFTMDFFSLLLEGCCLYSEAMVKRLVHPQSLVLASGRATATVTSSYQGEILKKFMQMVLRSTARVTKQQIAVGIAHATLCHVGFTWHSESSLLNKSKKLDLALIDLEGQQLFPTQYRLEGSDLSFRFATLKLKDGTEQVLFSLKSEGASEIEFWKPCKTNHLPMSPYICLTADDEGAAYVITKVLEILQEFLSKAILFAAPISSTELSAWTQASNAACAARRTLIDDSSSDSDREIALNDLREKLSVLGPRGIHDPVHFQQKREDQIRKNEQHRLFRNRLFSDWEMSASNQNAAA